MCRASKSGWHKLRALAGVGRSRLSWGLGRRNFELGFLPRRFLFRGITRRMERSRTPPAAVPRGVGRPLGGLGEGARYLWHRFPARASKFFSKYSPGAAARLAAPPCALHAARGDEGQPRGTRNGVNSMETRVEAAGPVPTALRLPWTPSRLNFWGANGVFSILSALRSFPEDVTVPAALCRASREGRGFVFPP